MKYKLNKIAYFICAIILNITSTGFSASTGCAGGGGGGPLADMELSRGGFAALRYLEKYEEAAYIEPTSKPGEPPLISIGYGHLVIGKDTALASVGVIERPVRVGVTKISLESAEQLLLMDAETRAKIKHLVYIPLNQNQFDAISLLCYNYGETKFSRSKALKYLNANNFAKAMDEIIDINSGMQGLVKRRFAEISIFFDTEFSTEWADVSSHLGLSIPKCDTYWAGLKKGTRLEVVTAYKKYTGR